jgi:SNF2 family DNA or RNA helicase
MPRQWPLKGTPYPVQVEALKRSKGKERFAWFMQMGQGKSAVVLADWADNLKHLHTIVVIAPNSFRLDWTLLPAEWGLKMTTSLWPKDEFKAGTKDKPHLCSINFEAVRSRGYDVVRDLLDKHDCLLVIDEGSYIKNFKSQTARAVMDLAKRAKAVRLLNGTPLVQSVLDLFPQLKCVGELDKVNPYAFRNRYAVMGGFMGRQVVGVRNEEDLHAIQERCSFRSIKKDWWDGCPEQLDVPLNLEMTPKQQKHYKEMLRDFCTEVEGEEFTANMVISRCDKLRQITSGLILDGDKCVFIEPIDKNPKALAALDLMEASPTKLIVVHFYSKMGFALEEFFANKKLNPAHLRGNMKPDDVLAQKQKFNDDPSCRVLTAQITSASMAHTLTGAEGDNRCHRMIFHDLDFSLKNWLQMRDRIHRGEQDRGCLYYVPIMSPIDKAQLKALEKKENLADAVVNVVRALKH